MSIVGLFVLFVYWGLGGVNWWRYLSVDSFVSGFVSYCSTPHRKKKFYELSNREWTDKVMLECVDQYEQGKGSLRKICKGKDICIATLWHKYVRF